MKYLLYNKCIGLMPVAYSMNYSMPGQSHIQHVHYNMPFAFSCVLPLSPPFSPCQVYLGASMQLCGCMGIYVWREEQCFIICLHPMRCKQKAVFMQPLPALHRSCKQRVAGLCQFLPKKKRKRSQARKLIFSKHFLVFTDGNRQGNVVYMWWGWHLWLFR